MHEALQGELFRQGLPAAAVARLLDELADHFEDLQAEDKEAGGMATIQEIEPRLGHPRMLAEVAGAAHRNSYFLGRHPIWGCLVAPVPLVLLCFAACVATVIGFGYCADLILDKSFGLEGKSADQWPAIAVGLAHGIVYFLRFVPPILATVIMTWKVRQAGLANKWLWISFCPVAVIAASFLAILQLPQVGTGGNLTMGLNFPMHVQSLLHVIAPLAIVIVVSVLNRVRTLRVA
jgi:hypothetical protein